MYVKALTNKILKLKVNIKILSFPKYLEATFLSKTGNRKRICIPIQNFDLKNWCRNKARTSIIGTRTKYGLHIYGYRNTMWILFRSTFCSSYQFSESNSVLVTCFWEGGCLQIITEILFCYDKCQFISCQVVLMSVSIPVTSSSLPVVFLSGHLPIRLSPCQFIYLTGCLPVRSYSC